MENHIRKNRRIIVGISGASGVILGYEMLKDTERTGFHGNTSDSHGGRQTQPVP